MLLKMDSGDVNKVIGIITGSLWALCTCTVLLFSGSIMPVTSQWDNIALKEEVLEEWRLLLCCVETALQLD